MSFEKNPRASTDKTFGAVPKEGRGVNVFEELAEEAKSLSHLGVCLWFVFVRSRRKFEDDFRLGTAADFQAWWKKFSQGHRVPRVSRALFPLPSRWEKFLEGFPQGISLDEVLLDVSFGMRFGHACWSELCIYFLNHLYNCSVGLGPSETSFAQEEFLGSIERCVGRWLSEDSILTWRIADIEKDFSKRSISYTGEEVCKAEPLSVYRVAPALPPQSMEEVFLV